MDSGLERSKLIITTFIFVLAAGKGQAAICDPCCTQGGCSGSVVGTGCPSGMTSVTIPFSMDCDNCCYICKRGERFVWPVSSQYLADESIDSACDGDPYTFPDNVCLHGHRGLDLEAQDDEPIYAAFSGTVYQYNESGNDPNEYYIGCGLKLVSYSGEKRAYYGHLELKDMIPDGTNVTAGAEIGRAGGDQDNLYCRGSSQGPELYFEMQQYDFNTGQWEYVDPDTCITDNSNFWYTDSSGNDCVPDENNLGDCEATVFTKYDPVTRRSEPVYEAPSYSCQYNSTTMNWMFADVNINNEGDINLTCSGTGANKTCNSEVYTYNTSVSYRLTPVIASQPDGQEDMSSLNCFLRFMRVWNNGNVSCGGIVGTGSNIHVEYSDENCSQLMVGLGTSQPDESRNIGIDNVQPIVGGESEANFMGDVVESKEYSTIGLDDRYFIQALKNQDANSSIEINPVVTPYYIDYIMIRQVDDEGTVKYSEACKVKQLGLKDSPWVSQNSYSDMVKSVRFDKCEHIVIDAGKFYDNPSYYIALNQFSRLAANREELYYTQF